MPTKIETGRGMSVIDNATVTVTNSTSEVSLFSSTIQAKKMGLNKAMRFTVICRISTAVSLVPTLTARLKLGSSTLTIMNATVLGLAITNVPFSISGLIANQGAANSQFVYAEIQQDGNVARSASADWAVDTSQDQSLSITAQFGGLSVGTSITSKFSMVELT